MAGDPVSKNGVFIDSKTGKVVESRPEEGVQLVAPGDTITADAQAVIDRVKADADEAVKTEKATTRSR